MFKKVAIALSLIISAFNFVQAACAGIITSQAQLSSILGSNEIFENFEGNGKLSSGQFLSVSGVLSSTSTFAGYGPGLVQAGATYSAPQLWWNDNGYFGLNSRTLADSSEWRGDAITITYNTLVNAMGFDMQGYQGLPKNGTVNVYDLGNQLVASVAVDGGFFGWENGAGIGHVTIGSGSGYIMIDNHGFGTAGAPVPEPGTIALVGAGFLGLAVYMKRRKNA